MRFDFPHLNIEISAEVDFCFHPFGYDIAEDPHFIAEPQQTHACRPAKLSFVLFVIIKTEDVKMRSHRCNSAFESKFRIGYGVLQIFFDFTTERGTNVYFFLHFIWFLL